MRQHKSQLLEPSPFLKDVAYTTATSVATGLGLIVLTRLLAQGLGPEEFGIYALSRRVLATVAPLSTISMGTAVARYTAMHAGAERRWFLLGGLVLAVAPSIVLFGIGTAFRDELSSVLFRSDCYAATITATLFMLVGYSFYTVLYAFYRGTGRMAMANLWQLAVLVLGPIFVAWTYARTGQVHLILYLLGALLLSTTVPLGAELWNGAGWQTSLTGALRAGKELLRYGLPRVPGGLLLAGLFSLGPLLAPYFGSAKEAGYLAVGQSIFAVSEAGLTAFGLVVLPKVAQLVAEGRVGFLRERISDVLAFTIHFGLFTAIQLFVWSDVLVQVWLGDSYSEAIPLMRILLLAAVPYFVYVMLRSMIDGLEEKAVNTRNLSISAAVAAGFSLGLGIAGFGARGLAVGTALGLITLGLTTVRYLWAEGWIAPKRVHLTACLLLNAGALGAAGLSKMVISQLHLSTPGLFGLALLLESILFVLYNLSLRRLGVGWTVQVEKRLVGGKL